MKESETKGESNVVHLLMFPDSSSFKVFVHATPCETSTTAPMMSSTRRNDDRSRVESDRRNYLWCINWHTTTTTTRTRVDLWHIQFKYLRKKDTEKSSSCQIYQDYPVEHTWKFVTYICRCIIFQMLSLDFNYSDDFSLDNKTVQLNFRPPCVTGRPTSLLFVHSKVNITFVEFSCSYISCWRRRSERVKAQLNELKHVFDVLISN